MGCSAAKNLMVEPIDNGKSERSSSEKVKRKVSVPHSLLDVPLEGEDPQTEIIENATVNNLQKGNNGLSFEIAFVDENNDESIIKKHPPKRFQRLEEIQTSPTATLVKLQEKLDEAEIRRQQILQQRVQSAKLRQTLTTKSSQNSLEADGDDHLKVPPDIPQPTNPYDVSYV